MTQLEYVLPGEIEKRSFEIIDAQCRELGLPPLSDDIRPVVYRAIHTSADFDYYENLKFSDGAVPLAHTLLKEGATIVTDTNMGLAGINKTALKKLGARAVCFMADPDVARASSENGTTRAASSVDRAAQLEGPVIYAVGNAPTALVRLSELIESGAFRPALVIGVPVGFVNVTAAKEMIMEAGVPYIVAVGRKGGSNIAAAIINALMYETLKEAGSVPDENRNCSVSQVVSDPVFEYNKYVR